MFHKVLLRGNSLRRIFWMKFFIREDFLAFDFGGGGSGKYSDPTQTSSKYRNLRETL